MFSVGVIGGNVIGVEWGRAGFYGREPLLLQDSLVPPADGRGIPGLGPLPRMAEQAALCLDICPSMWERRQLQKALSQSPCWEQ